MALYYDFIPRSHLMLRSQVYGNAEEWVYTILKRTGSIRDPKLNCAIWVKEVQGRRLLDVVFKKIDGKGGYSQVARAREAEIHFDADAGQIRVDMTNCVSVGEGESSVAIFREKTFLIDLPKNYFGHDYVPRPSDLTWQELQRRRVDIVDEIAKAAELAQNPPTPPAAFGPAEVNRWKTAFKDELKVKQREQAAIEVELHQRPALAIGCLCFVLLGGPVGIWFSKSDYLSAFVSCFLPTSFIYYPLLLCGTNLSKDGRIPPTVGLWAANAVAGVAALIMYGRLFRR